MCAALQLVAYLDTVLLSQLDDAGINDGIDVGRVVSALLGVVLASEPLHDVETLGSVELDWVSIEQIRHHHEVAVCGELVSNKLGIVELVADDVGNAM